jgi:hypothetical protein
VTYVRVETTDDLSPEGSLDKGVGRAGHLLFGRKRRHVEGAR